jgi:hypothetical protein
VCETCNDGVCSPATENCFNCPGDCGTCAGCGDGICGQVESCASCKQDCGVCSFCGNDICEEFESCSNCNADCGECDPLGCLEVVNCSLGCIDLQQDPPDFNVGCVANCIAAGCADVQFFVNQMLQCAIQQLGECGGDPDCILGECSSELAACIGANCD